MMQRQLYECVTVLLVLGYLSSMQLLLNVNGQVDHNNNQQYGRHRDGFFSNIRKSFGGNKKQLSNTKTPTDIDGSSTGDINDHVQQLANNVVGITNDLVNGKLASHGINVIKRVAQRGGGTAALAVVGTFSGITKRLHKLDWTIIKSAVWKAIDIADIVALISIGYVTEPLARYYYKMKHTTNNNKQRKQGLNDESDVTQQQEEKSTTIADIIADYEDSYLYKTANVIQELGRLGCFMYGFDLVSIIIRKAGFVLSNEVNARIGQTSIAIWSASRIRRLKQIWMYKIMKQNPEGRAAWLSRALDGGLLIVLYFFISDIFQVTIGKGLQSIAAVGGLSTIIFGLAAKDFAQMLIAGIAIYNSDKFYEGEKVRFGDGTTGKIDHQGPFELHIRGSDGIVTRIPNIHIINQRVQNLSRTTSSTIKQVLWFRYEDINKLPIVLDTILQEIRLACPKLIDDGSRTFQAVWTDYKHDHLEVEVEASFLIPPTVDEFDLNKQDMLMAIARAVQKNNVQFAIPTSLCLSKEIAA